SSVTVSTPKAYPGGVSLRRGGTIHRRVRPALQEYPQGVYGCTHTGTRRGYPDRGGYPMAANEYQVAGMTCGHCEMSVRAEVSEISGVTDIQVSAQTGKLVVSASG